jgi:hypothetical protein
MNSSSLCEASVPFTVHCQKKQFFFDFKILIMLATSFVNPPELPEESLKLKGTFYLSEKLVLNTV